VITVGAALELVAEHTPRLSAERVTVAPPLVGRVLAADVTAAVSLPSFAVSAMDGYAVRAVELGGAPVPIGLRVAAGDRPGVLARGTAAAIATGAPVPEGADAVVPIEDARELDGALVADVPEAGAAIRPVGGDIRAGDVVVTAGTVLGPAGLAALAAAGVADVLVARRPRLAAIATGSELVASGRPLEPGQIYESNLTAIAAQSLRVGAELVLQEVVADEREATEQVLRRALEADVVVSSGGVSVGPHDHVKPALAALGVREVFWRVNQKPGKPLWFGVAESGALVFGLPGNPVSSLVCFELYVRPALLAMQGAAVPPRAVARLAVATPRLGGRLHAMRSKLVPTSDGMTVVPAGAQESHLIAHAAIADVVALVEPGVGDAAAGTLVEYVPL
jgi:molybdopterin molybdotransferase